MNIYFLRHAESTFNVNSSDDTIDCPLTLNGIEQSKCIDCSTYPSHYSLVICSPLRRCLDTIKLSKITYDKFEINELFREIRAGCKSDLLNENETILVETEGDIQQRLAQIAAFLIEKKDANVMNLLIVTHSDLVWSLTAQEVDGERFGTWLKNAQLYFWKQI